VIGFVTIQRAIHPGQSAHEPFAACPQAAYSAVSGATAAFDYPTLPSGGWSDDTLQDFDPAAPGNPGPIKFTVDLSACVAGNSEGLAWSRAPGKLIVRPSATAATAR
jgi:hypothetical protein